MSTAPVLRPATPHVFISACSRDLKTFRTILAAQLVRLGFHPVFQEDFALTAKPLLDKLRDLIRPCDFVIHIAGLAFGAEPREQPDGIRRRSYTQHEYFIAQELGIPVYAFICADSFPYDTPDPKRYQPERAEALQLQQDHRTALARTPENKDYARIDSIRQGIKIISESNLRLSQLTQHLESFLPAVHSLQRETLDAVLRVEGKVDLLLEQQASARGYQRTWNMPPRAAQFFGHEQDFIEILALWQQHRVLAITGTGGRGKTGLAAEVLAWFGPSPEHSGAFPRRLFMHDYYTQPDHLSALSSLVAQTGQDPAGMSLDQLSTAVRSQLCQPDTYLYLEGCERAKDVLSLLDLTGSARVLLTTRDQVPPAGVEGWALPPLTEEAAAGLIAHLAGLELDRVQSLAKFLGGHALASRLAGLVLAKQIVPPKDLLAELEEDGLQALGGEDEQHRSVHFLLKTTASYLEQSHPGTGLVWGLLAIGALSPLPIGILREMVKLSDTHSALAEDKKALRQLLEAMQRQGILHTRLIPGPVIGETEPAVQLSHALVQVYGLPKPHTPPSPCYLAWRKAWAAFLEHCWKNNGIPGGLQRYEALGPHWETLVTRLEEREPEDSASLSGPIHLMGALHFFTGRLLSAERLWRKALDLRERTLGPEQFETLKSLNNLASVLKSQGNFAAAETLLRRALEARERTLGPEHRDTLTSLNNLALLLSDKSDFAAAEPLYRRALEAQERTLGPEHPHTLRSLNNLGELLIQNGDLTAAEPLFRRALASMEITLGDDHPYTLVCLHNHGVLHQVRGELKEALAYFRRAEAWAQKLLLPEHGHRQIYEKSLKRVEEALSERGAYE